MCLPLNEHCIRKQIFEALGLSIVFVDTRPRNMGEEGKFLLFIEVMGDFYWLPSLEQKDEDIATDLDDLGQHCERRA